MQTLHCIRHQSKKVSMCRCTQALLRLLFAYTGNQKWCTLLAQCWLLIHAFGLQQDWKCGLAADIVQEDDEGSRDHHLIIGEGVQSSISGLLLGRALEKVQQILPPFICSSLTIKETTWHRSQCISHMTLILWCKHSSHPNDCRMLFNQGCGWSSACFVQAEFVACTAWTKNTNNLIGQLLQTAKMQGSRKQAASCL